MQKGRIDMLLFDVSSIDVDMKLNNIVELEDLSYNSNSYIVMSGDTFRLFERLSKHYDKIRNCWEYSGFSFGLPVEFDIAIDRKLNFGEVVVK